ncbi:alcohol dehydrogenase catalytic domain-containing protein [Glutamicibacter sp.]|uniref:alcohol dehydrogenase catalytic domain-containing protein n=1 Tax=Glutamicibacter sp. TaxID=1931995 RepID=UPI002B45F822|nr:alcohol dehydrogenase catalytic domain-containing protein [Glutamicibacter sp.]HJX79207.1 alcohol dehydrogenase catalytic domain-containing protein [Glutamicibacter sp.]
MPTIARAALARGFDGTFSIEEIQIDDPQGAEVLIEVRAVGLCQSDAHLSSIDLGIPAPLLMGHEISGIITEVGVQTAGLEVGDHVVATLIQYCDSCTACLAGEVYRCEQRNHTLRAAHDKPRITSDSAPVTQMFGTGGFASYALVHSHQVVKIPKNFPFPPSCGHGMFYVDRSGCGI